MATPAPAAARPYNSGLKRSDDRRTQRLRAGLNEIENAASARGVVFAHAIGTPYRRGEIELIERVECIYCELPWALGWVLFHARAGRTPIGSYPGYIEAVRTDIIARFPQPTFLVCGKAEAVRLSAWPPQPIRLNGGRAWLATAYVEDVPQSETTEDLLRVLAGRHSSVYDFGCGYGNALRPFRHFVGSDIDRRCLDYIARELL